MDTLETIDVLDDDASDTVTETVYFTDDQRRSYAHGGTVPIEGRPIRALISLIFDRDGLAGATVERPRPA